ncbi:MAG: hypothetical protein RL754_574 [Bacteroidota bacterium]
MAGLGAYAATNFVVSGVGYAQASQEHMKRFHEMNIMWNTVNMGLAIPGYIKASNSGQGLSSNEMLRKQRNTERVFLINGALDAVYVSAGIWMCTLAEGQPDNEALLTGYGNSLILQGSFLFAFDSFAYYLHHNHLKKHPLLDGARLYSSANGIGLRITLDR